MAVGRQRVDFLPSPASYIICIVTSALSLTPAMLVSLSESGMHTRPWLFPCVSWRMYFGVPDSLLFAVKLSNDVGLFSVEVCAQSLSQTMKRDIRFHVAF
jgi:hypothetical protein